jgi:hypothetical protein
MENGYAIERVRVPNASLKVLHRLGKTLVHDKPDITNPTIDISIDNLSKEITVAGTAMIGRFREFNPLLIAGEVDFDRSVDTVWIWVRRTIEAWRDIASHPGLGVLPPDLQDQVKLPALRAKGELAKKLHNRLFGADGTNWVKSSFIEQSQTMATILGVVEADGLREDLESIIGPDLMLLIETMQIQYEAMVSARMSREGRSSDNFRTLRAKLRWRIDHYKNAVESLRDPDKPQTYEVVERSLRSLILLSQRMTNGGSDQDTDESTDDEEIDEFIEDEEMTEQELIELGLPIDDAEISAPAP